MSVLDEISKAVDERGEEFTALSDQIWDNPELRWNEHDSMAAQIQVAQRAGFTREGLERKSIWLHGERHDAIVWSLLPTDPRGV